MAEKIKIIFVFFLFILFVGFCFLYFGHNQQGKINLNFLVNKKNQSLVKVDNEKLDNDYRIIVKKLVNDFLYLTDNNSLTIDKTKQIKNELLDLRVTDNYKNIHLNLVLSIAKMENFFNTGNNSDRLSSVEIINKTKSDNSWLN